MAAVRRGRWLPVLLALLAQPALWGCQANDSREDVPAHLVNPGPAGRAELARVVADALGAPVVLADDALTHTSLLSIARRPRGGLTEPRLPGREMGRPEQFRLVKSGPDCVLVHAASSARWRLTESRCAAAP